MTKLRIASTIFVTAAFVALFASLPLAQASSLSEGISPQPLAKALDAFAAQTGLQLVYRPEIAAGLKTRGAQAGKSVQDTLLELLRETGLTFEFVNDRTVTIQPTGVVTRGERVTERAGQSSGGAAITLARVDETGAETENAEQKKAAQSAAAGSERGVPEILVKGRRTSNADIRRSEDDVQPYVVFDSTDIEHSMEGSLGDFLKSRLPMNALAATPRQDEIGAFGNQSLIDLRGLGTNQTLVLVNGRRMPSVSTIPVTGVTVQPDINGIPMNTVERIEVLPSTASGIYGGGATGGVVNIVLKRGYSGVEVNATYNNTFDSDVAERSLSFSAGHNSATDRTSVLLSGSYSDSNPLLVRERDFTRRGRALNLQNNRAFLLGGQANIFGATPNIRSRNGMNLALKDGTMGGADIGHRVTYVPVGYPGISSDGGAALAANGGMFNFDIPDDVRGQRRSLLTHPTTESLSLSVRHELTRTLEAFADFSIFNNNSKSKTGFGSFTQNLAADAPNNPFVGPIEVTYPNTTIEFDTPVDSETSHAAAGLRLRLPRDWSAQFDYSRGLSRFRYSSTSPVISNAGEAAIANGTLDIVRDLNVFPLEVGPFLLPSPNNMTGPADSVLNDYSLRLAGPVTQMPGGKLVLSGVLSYREEEARNSFVNQLNFSTDEPEVLYYPSRGQKVKSLYVEATAPLIGEQNTRPLVHDLQLQASVRRDEYETETVPFGGFAVDSRSASLPSVDRVVNEVESTDYTFGVRYAPTRSLALRASYGTGFLAPSVADLFPFNIDFWLEFVSDPKRSGVPEILFPIGVVFGGNPDLQPEESTSWSGGLIFTPQSLPGLRLSVDYTRIEKTDEISSLTAQEVVSNEDDLPGRVERLPLTQADINAGFEGGAITRIDQSLVNIARSKLEAYDIQLDYVWDSAFGAFRAYALATYQPQFERQTLAESPRRDLVGYNGGVLEWRGNGGLTLTRGDWTLGWSTQYYHDYLVYRSEDQISQITVKVRQQGSPTIDSQIYHDAFFKYRFGAVAGLAGNFLADSEFTVGISNVFNSMPPILATTSATGGYSPYADPRLRRYSISWRKSF